MQVKEFFDDLVDAARRNPCQCPHCKFRRHIEHVKKRGKVDQMRRLIDELYELWDDVSTDLEMRKAEDAEDRATKEQPK